MLKNGKIAAAFFSILFCMLFFTSSHVFSAEKTIGVVFTGDVPYYQEIHAAFTAKLAKEGYSDKVQVFIQKPYPDSISLSNSIRKFIAIDVDVIVVYGAPALLASVSEKTKTPVVYAGVYDPLIGHLRSKNITGISSKVSVSSMLRYLRGLTDIKTLGVLYNTNEADSVYQMKELASLSSQYGFVIDAINITRHQQLGFVLSGKSPDALFVTGSSVAQMALPEIRSFADKLMVPYVSLFPDTTGHAVISLFAEPGEQGEKTAENVIKVLTDVAPEKISSEKSNNVALVFNLKEATSKGWRIPMELVTSATKLIR